MRIGLLQSRMASASASLESLTPVTQQTVLNDIILPLNVKADNSAMRSEAFDCIDANQKAMVITPYNMVYWTRHTLVSMAI